MYMRLAECQHAICPLWCLVVLNMERTCSFISLRKQLLHIHSTGRETIQDGQHNSIPRAMDEHGGEEVA